MKFRGAISIYIAVIALLVAHSLPAFQTPNTTSTVTKKARKATKGTADATSKAMSPATDTGKKAAKKAKKGAARQAASSTTDTAIKTTGRADRAASSTTDVARKPAAAPATIVSDQDIAAAKASGKVWVNTETGAYHKSGKWYGSTKHGKFMTEQDAIQAGYHAATR